MSTIYAFNQECPASTDFTDDDLLLLYDTSAGRTKSVTGRILGYSAGVGVVNSTATQITLTAASHAGKILTVSATAPCAIVLPQATGTGHTYRLNIRVAATATSHTIKVANSTDILSGTVLALTTSSANVIGYKTTATDDTITLDGTTLGGVVGDQIEIVDIKTGIFQVCMVTAPTGSTATPFSATV